MSAELLSWTVGVHGTLFPISLLGLYRYADRTELFAKSAADVDDLLARMGRRVAAELAERLEPVFERSEGEPRIVVPDSYTERATNPVGSEAYHEALRGFVDEGAGILVAYARTRRAKARWCTFARVLSWTILLLAIWEVICLALFGLLGKLFGVDLPAEIARWSFGPTSLLVILFFVCQWRMLQHHDVIQSSKAQYRDL